MVEVGKYNTLKVLRLTENGLYLDDGKEGILLPKRYVPPGVEPGDELEVFIHHDSDDRIIATTEKPKGILGDIIKLKAVSSNRQGAFLDWGLMKDLFVPKSQQINDMYPEKEYLVKIYLDEMTGRLAATEKIDRLLNNDELTVKELDIVDLVVYRRSDIGYVMIINNKHIGLLHHNEVFQKLEVGDKLTGFIKKIYPETNKIDVVTGKPGYGKVSGEAEKVLQLLKDANGYLPYNDKSDPEDIYDFFGMSKKTFKMATGQLYKNKTIVFTSTGIKLLEQ